MRHFELSAPKSSFKIFGNKPSYIDYSSIKICSKLMSFLSAFKPNKC